MKWENIKVHWLEYRTLARRRWVALSDEQIESIGGHRDLLAECLQSSYGVSREHAESEIEAWSSTFDDEDQESSGRALEAGGAALAKGAPPGRPDLRRRTHPRR